MRKLQLFAVAFLLLVPATVRAQTVTIQPNEIRLDSACYYDTGSGSPNSSKAGAVCDQYLQTDGTAAGGILWVKTTGSRGATSTTGWVAPALSGGTTLFGDGSSGAPTIAFNSESTLGFYRPSSGNIGITGHLLPSVTAAKNLGSAAAMFNDFYVTRIGGGGAGGTFTTPTRSFDWQQTQTGAGSTAYAAALFKLLMTPASAPSGQARALEMHVQQSGTQNHTGEITAGLFSVENSTSGTVTEENAGLFAAQRTGGPATTSRGIRIDRNYSSASAITESYGLVVNSPNLTGGSTIGTNIGLLIANQSGATTSANFTSQTANSGTLTHYSDGSLSFGFTKTSTANTAVSGSNRYTALLSNISFTGGANTGYHYIHEFNINASPSADTPGEAWVGLTAGSLCTGTHNCGILAGVYPSATAQGTGNVDAWDPGNGGGINALLADGSNYTSSGTVPNVSVINAWGGTGSGSTTTNFFQVHVPNLYDYSGTVTNLVGVQVDAMTTTGVTNAYALRIGSANTGSANQGVMASGAPFDAVQAITVADNGAGTNATSTITPTAGQVEVTCSDAQGCDITLDETGIVRGQRVTFVCLSAVAINFADTAGVSETAGAYACGQYDTISFRYISDRWIETGRSNN